MANALLRGVSRISRIIIEAVILQNYNLEQLSGKTVKAGGFRLGGHIDGKHVVPQIIHTISNFTACYTIENSSEVSFVESSKYLWPPMGYGLKSWMEAKSLLFVEDAASSLLWQQRDWK